MGLFSGLILLPLAPLRGTIWLAEKLALEAERELDEERTARRLLLEAVDEFEQIEDELLERLERARAATLEQEL